MKFSLSLLLAGFALAQGQGLRSSAGFRAQQFAEMRNNNNNVAPQPQQVHGSGVPQGGYAGLSHDNVNPHQNLPTLDQMKAAGVVEHFDPPTHPTLSKGSYPVTHGTTYNQDASPWAAPTDPQKIVQDEWFDRRLPSDPITLTYSNDNRVIWASTFRSVYKLRRDTEHITSLGYIEREFAPTVDGEVDLFHGAYCFVDKNDIFYTSTATTLEAFGSTDPNNSLSAPVKLPKTAGLPTGAKGLFRGMTLAYDGTLIYVTSGGTVGALNTDTFEHLAMMQLQVGGEEVAVSNNIAADEDGHIFVVTSKKMERVDWDPSTNTFKRAWSTPYESAGLISGRLGVGSGTTPTIIGSKERGRFVVVGDGMELMNVVWFDTETGLIAGVHPVTFGKPGVKRTTTEQSLLGYGYRIMVTSNDYRDDMTLQELGSAVGVDPQILSGVPVLSGDAPTGIEAFDIDPITWETKSAWSNSEISIPNGIPHLSVPTRTVFGIGKKDGRYREAGPYTGIWALEAIDWDTGKERYALQIGDGRGYSHNSLYAACQIGYGGEVMTGTVTGITRFYDEDNFQKYNRELNYNL